MYIIQETGINTLPKKKKCKRVKRLSGEALQIAVKRRGVKSKKRRKDISTENRVPKNSQEK